MSDNITPDQLDEIEAVAREARLSQWRWPKFDDLEQVNGHVGAHSRHIAMMDPAATLALVAEVRKLRSRLLDVRSVVDVVDASASGAVEYCHPYTHEWRAVAPDLFRALGEEA